MVAGGYRPARPKKMDEELYSLIEWCWRVRRPRLPGLTENALATLDEISVSNPVCDVSAPRRREGWIRGLRLKSHLCIPPAPQQDPDQRPQMSVVLRSLTGFKQKHMAAALNGQSDSKECAIS